MGAMPRPRHLLHKIKQLKTTERYHLITFWARCGTILKILFLEEYGIPDSIINGQNMKYFLIKTIREIKYNYLKSYFIFAN